MEGRGEYFISCSNTILKIKLLILVERYAYLFIASYIWIIAVEERAHLECQALVLQTVLVIKPRTTPFLLSLSQNPGSFHSFQNDYVLQKTLFLSPKV